MKFDLRIGGRLFGLGLSSARGLFYSTLVLVLALIFSMPVEAQRITGTLRGQILDPSGAAVPDAQVTATNQETGVSVKITTTSAGTYSFPSLIPGNYKIGVEAKGFKNFLKTEISVIANQDNVADAHLDLGVATEVVEVSGGGVAIQTTSSELNNTFDANSVAGLPSAAGTLNGSPLNLAVLAPNVVAQPGGVTGIGGSVGGTRPRDNKFSAEYGHSAGGQFSLVTKTGTNNVHGSGEWYNQNKNYNSLDNLTKNAIAGGTIPGKPDYDNNRFGGTLGGPVIKNKWFLFGAYEYTTLHGQGTATPLIQPTAAGLATLEGMAVNSVVKNLLTNFPVAPAGDLGTVAVTANGVTNNVPIGNLIIISPNFQREHDVQFNSDYTWGKHQFGARFLLNQEK